MQFKTTSLRKPSEGLSFIGVEVLVVPDQAMSLEEILKRFTRSEPLPVGFNGRYDDDVSDEDNPEKDIDLEKLVHADLVDRAIYAEKMRAIVKEYEKQEDAKTSAQKKAAAEAARKKEKDALRAEILAEQSSEKSAE